MSGLAPGLPESDDALDAQSGTQDAQHAHGVGPKTWGWDQHGEASTGSPQENSGFEYEVIFDLDDWC